MKITATYSPEDNKLRLYTEDNERLDAETYAKVREAGFVYAPVQKLFVAPAWSPAREDICMELAGDIFPEESTMLERAQMKAERLDNLRHKNLANANAFSRAAHSVAERMVAGQPILVGHHSERKARKDVQRMKAAQERAEKCAEAAQYWSWRAEGVEAHANHKADPRTRANRIDKLLADLRDHQRDINHGYLVLNLWSKIDAEKDPERREQLARHYVGSHLKTGPATRSGDYDKLSKGVITVDEAIQRGKESGQARIDNEYHARFVAHILNRLGYERSEMPDTPRYDGVFTAAVLQTFARAQGAHKPEATRNEDGSWKIVSTVPLPCHVGDGCECVLTDDEWRDLMQGCGYTVPAAKKLPPILNFRIGEDQGFPVTMYRSTQVHPQVVMTKAEYDAVYEGRKGVRVHQSGEFRFRVILDPRSHKSFAVFLSDSKAHPAPENCTVGLQEGCAA